MTGQKQKSTPVWCINKFKKQLFLTPVCVFRLFPAGGSAGVQGGGRAGAGPPPPRLRRPWRRLPRPPPIVLAVAVVLRYYSDGRLWSNGTCFFCRPGPPRPSSAAASSSPSLQRGCMCIYIYIAIKRCIYYSKKDIHIILKRIYIYMYSNLPVSVNQLFGPQE